jgi:hypothetical protein
VEEAAGSAVDLDVVAVAKEFLEDDCKAITAVKMKSAIGAHAVADERIPWGFVVGINLGPTQTMSGEGDGFGGIGHSKLNFFSWVAGIIATVHRKRLRNPS